jgi:tetratricopeptide (TPR) repeat protein
VLRLGKVKRDARAADALVIEAAALAAAGRTGDAEQVLVRAHEADPAWIEPKRALVQLLAETGNEPRALEVAARALAEHPGDHDLLITAAIAHERLGALAEAAETLALVLAADSNHLLANRRMAPLLERVGDRQGATRCLRRIVAITGGQDLETALALGIALSGSGEHAEAIGLLTEVVRRRPDAISVRADLAMALLSAGQIDEALSEFTAVLRLDPRSAQAHCGVGLVYQQLQRWVEAAEAFRATEALAPELPVAPFNLGLVLAAAGDREGARRALLRAAALAPDDAEIREALQGLAQPPPPPPAPAPPAVEPAPASRRFAGDLKSFALPDVLELLRLQKKTGALVLSSRRGAGLVRLARGEITSASAPGVLRLGEALVARGLVTPAELQAALARQAGSDENGEALGTMLMRNRPGDEEQLTRAVFAQVLAALEEMLGWREGEFSFHPAREADSPAISFDLRNVMLEIVRLSDEREHNAVRS